jgi:hypothetical protein
MRGVRRCLVFLLCAAGTTHPGRAAAQSAAPIELRWNALESCPSADTVLARVHKIAGSTRPTPNTLRAEATITQPGDGLFRLRLKIEYGKLAAVRNIEGKSCKDLAGATAVALALLLSSEEPLSERDLAGTSTTPGAPGGDQEHGTQAAVQNQPPTPPRASVPTLATSPSVEPAGPARRWRVLLVAPIGALSFGPLEQISRGLGLAAGFTFDRWRFLAEGRLWASQRETLTNYGDEYAVELNRFTVGARACRNLLGSRFELAPCALMSVHQLSSRGSGPGFVPGTDTATWAAIGMGAQARLLITPWLGLVAGVDGELQLSRPEVGVTLPVTGFPPMRAIPVERLAPVAATITVGSQWIF